MKIKWINTYWTVPSTIKDMGQGTAAIYKVVAIVGAANDWSAYRGPTDWDDEKVAEEGDKMSKHVAETMFPAFANSGLRYRE